MNIIKINNGDDIPKNYTGNTEFPNGDKYWYLNGLWHREDGPAIEWSNGGKEWWVNGMLHRLDGPAIEYKNGDKYWFLNGTQSSQEEWFERLSAEDKLNAIWNLK
jgi:hypothetical protein